MLKQPIYSLGHTLPIFTTFQWIVLSQDFREAKITFPPPITFHLIIRVQSAHGNIVRSILWVVYSVFGHRGVTCHLVAMVLYHVILALD